MEGAQTEYRPVDIDIEGLLIRWAKLQRYVSEGAAPDYLRTVWADGGKIARVFVVFDPDFADEQLIEACKKMEHARTWPPTHEIIFLRNKPEGTVTYPLTDELRGLMFATYRVNAGEPAGKIERTH